MKHRVIAILTAVALCASASVADTLNFSGLPAGDLGGTLSTGGVTIESTTNLVNMSDQYFSAAGGAICANKNGGNNCRGTMNIKFNGKVRALTFFSAGYQPGDGASIVVYRGAGVIGVSGFSWNGKVDLRVYGKITKIKISYTGVEDGMAIGKFDFTRVAANAKQVAHRTEVRTERRADIRVERRAEVRVERRAEVRKVRKQIKR